MPASTITVGFFGAVFGAVQRHADAAGWLPVYWNIGDEPVGDDVPRSAENAEAYRKAFPKGPPFFTAASSFRGDKRDDPHFRLSRRSPRRRLDRPRRGERQPAPRSGRRLGLLQRRQPLDLRRLLYKAAKQFDMKFRVSWHWNNVAGDPYYALDCREDDYAWCMHERGRRVDPDAALRASARGTGRLSPSADAGATGQGARRHPGRARSGETAGRNPPRFSARRSRVERRRKFCEAASASGHGN